MRALGDRFSILQKTTLEEYMGEGNQQRLFVNRSEKPLKRDCYAVIRSHSFNSDLPIPRMSFIDIHHRRKVQFRIDDFVSLGRRFKTGKDERLANGDVLMHD